MRRLIYSVLVLALLPFAGCDRIEEFDDDMHREGDVVLSIKTVSGVVSRASVEDTSLEERIDWVDVFVFNTDADRTVFHKERIDVSAAPVYKQGEFSLQKKRDEFDEKKAYYVYLVANAKAELVSDQAGVETWADLQELVQTDNDIQFSAFVDGDGKPAFEGAPARFLMDGFVYLSDSGASAAKAPTQMGTCVINDPEVKDVLLCGTLYRAAAKFIINIKPGSSVEFKKELEDADKVKQTPQYYINQLPVSTRVLPQAADDYYNPTTQNTVSTGLNPYTFVWNDDNSMTITGYGYADDWSRLEYTKQTSMVFNIPMLWDKDKDAANGREESSADNWYTIPLSKEKVFNRNTCYVINITINAVGAEEKDYAIELQDIEYVTLPWHDVHVGLGGYNAAFLTLNTDLVKIYNTNIDEDQLTFTSSSPISSIKLKDTFSHNEQNGAFSSGTDGTYAYYIDKFGQKIQLGDDPSFDIKVVEHPDWTKEQILAKEANLYKKEGVADNEQHIRAEVWDEHKKALNGNITIHSPILPVEDNEDLNWPSHFNTVRYLEFEVTNEQGITAVFRVEQIPVTVISNVEGFFSYRSDFCINDAPQYYNVLAFTTNFPTNVGVTKPVDKYGPHHYLNPREPFWSVSGFIPYHTHECDENGTILYECGDTEKNNPTNDEMVYGLMSRDYYRAFDIAAGVFHRDHYVDINGNPVPEDSKTTAGASKYYQAIGVCYKDPETGKYYRRHYTGQLQSTFYSKFVSKVYQSDGKNANGKARKRGEADINTQMPITSDTKPWGPWTSWGLGNAWRNHRMYHVRITSTSNYFTVALPKMMDEDGKPTDDRANGYTMEGENNSRMVSPSFMVASQLGSTNFPVNDGGYARPGVAGFYIFSRHQCREYVETYYEDTKEPYGEYTPGEPVYHYDDWRLPTKAEVEYIIQYQSASRAMDKVMNAQYYFVASTTPDVYDESTVYSPMIQDYESSYAGHYMRCVRDAITEPEPVIYDAEYNIVSGNPVQSH